MKFSDVMGMVSVCMATYNGAKYIREQLESILCQLSENDEVIISDDGSTDETLEIIFSYQDSRIKLFRHVPVSGSSFMKATRNFENALMHASGDYIFLSDQDDVWCEGKLQICLRYLREYVLVQHLRSYIITDKNCILPPERRIPTNLIGVMAFLPSCYSGCCMAFRRELLDLILPIPQSVSTHDSWIGCLAFMKNGQFNINKQLVQYRVLTSTVSYGKSKNSLLKKVRYRIGLLSQLLIRYYFYRSKRL